MRLGDIRKKLAAEIQSARPDLNVYATVPGTAMAPAVVIVPHDKPTARLDVSMGLGPIRYYLSVYVLVPFTEMDDGQDTLDELIDPKNEDSVLAALWGVDLGGADISFGDILEYGGEFQSANVPHIGAKIAIEVYSC